MIRDFRCCMCPNISNPQSQKCPTGPFKGQESPCEFAVDYIDGNGAVVLVASGLPADGNVWMTVRRVRADQPPHRVTIKALPIRETFDEAQADLNVYAKRKGWQAV